MVPLRLPWVTHGKRDQARATNGPLDAMLKLVTDHDVKPEQVARVAVRAGSNILNPLRSVFDLV